MKKFNTVVLLWEMDGEANFLFVYSEYIVFGTAGVQMFTWSESDTQLQAIS